VPDGSSFAGWATSPDGDVAYAPGATFTLDKDGTTLYAKFTQNRYNVYYNMNGGPAISADTGKLWGDTVAAVGEGWTDGTFYTDHIFRGWGTYASQDTKKPTLRSATSVGNLIKNVLKRGTAAQSVTLYALWDVRQVTIRYEVVGGSGTVKVIGSDKKPAGSASETFGADSSAAGATAQASEGYRFLGWYDKAYGEDGATLLATGASYVPHKPASGLWANATYYAWFTPHLYTVQFHAGTADAAAASAGMADQPMAYGTWEALSPRNLQIVRPGYTFKSWNTQQDG